MECGHDGNEEIICIQCAADYYKYSTNNYCTDDC